MTLPWLDWTEAEVGESTRNVEMFVKTLGREILGYLEKRIQTPMAQGWSSQIISMKKWVQTSKLSIKNSLSVPYYF